MGKWVVWAAVTLGMLCPMGVALAGSSAVFYEGRVVAYDAKRPAPEGLKGRRVFLRIQLLPRKNLLILTSYQRGTSSMVTWRRIGAGRVFSMSDSRGRVVGTVDCQGAQVWPCQKWLLRAVTLGSANPKHLIGEGRLFAKGLSRKYTMVTLSGRQLLTIHGRYKRISQRDFAARPKLFKAPLQQSKRPPRHAFSTPKRRSSHTYKFPIQVRAMTFGRIGVAGATVRVGQTIVGTTGSDGRFSGLFFGVPGQRVSVVIEGPGQDNTRQFSVRLRLGRKGVNGKRRPTPVRGSVFLRSR